MHTDLYSYGIIFFLHRCLSGGARVCMVCIICRMYMSVAFADACMYVHDGSYFYSCILLLYMFPRSVMQHGRVRTLQIALYRMLQLC